MNSVMRQAEKKAKEERERKAKKRKERAEKDKLELKAILERGGIRILRFSFELDDLIKQEGPDVCIIYYSTTQKFEDFDPY